jgi:NAD(P) transhydrogenase subunit beta
VNPRLKDADVALVVGACDVVNPAAIHTQGTPISGMPILAAHEARRVIVFNLDEKPGYSGVPNTLYDDPRTLLLLGDAKETVAEVIRRLG